MKSILFLTLLLVTLTLQQQKYQIRKLGQFRQRYPAHLRLARLPHRNSSWSLIMTEFDGSPFTWSRINEVPDIASKITNARDIGNIRSRHIVPNRILKWANEVKRIPYEVFNADYISNADGFLVPLHTDGDFFIIKVNPGVRGGLHSFNRPQAISQRKSTWFYHNAIWVDMNGDGRIDVITARASLANGRENAEGELLWLEHPAENAETSRWKEHILAKGPDVSIKEYNFLRRNDQIQIVAAQFWKKSVEIYNIQKGPSPKVLWSKVVTDSIGFPYDLRFGDLNGDGRDEILVTNHEDDENAGLFAFEIPNDLQHGIYRQHIIRQGYVTRQPGQWEASPGFPFLFYPKKGMTGRPHIMVAGDGTQQAYYYYPIGETGFEYGGGPFVRLGGVVGDIAFEDIDNDGFMELFVPSYHGGEMHVFKFYDPSEPQNQKDLTDVLDSFKK